MPDNNAAATADLTKLVQAFQNASKQAPGMAERFMDNAADQIKERMQAYAPRRTGKLYQSIRVTKSPNTWTIGPVDVPYAVYQEFGTATRGEFGGSEYVIKPKHGGRLTFKIGDRWVSTKEVHHPGIPPHPFARPAAREVMAGLTGKFGDAGVDLITKGKAS